MYIQGKSAITRMKKKKGQTLLVLIMFMLITMLVYLGLTLGNQTEVIQKMNSRANASSAIMFVDDMSMKSEYGLWAEEQAEIEASIQYLTYATSIEYIKDDEKSSELVFLTEFVNESPYDRLFETETTEVKAPRENEIVVSYESAKRNGFEIGQVITFTYDEEEFEFVISGFAVDPQFSSPMISPDRYFISEGFYEDNGIKDYQGIIGLKFVNEVVDETIIEERFRSAFPSLNPLYFSEETLIVSYNLLVVIISGILMVVAIFITIIALVIIHHIIRQAIIQKYREIGVMKVIGYSGQQIRQSFVIQFIGLGIVSGIFGVVLGIVVKKQLLSQLFDTILVTGSSTFDQFAVVTILIVNIVILVSAIVSTIQVNGIKPVQAIKYGMPLRKFRQNKFKISGKGIMPISILLSIKQILGSKRKSVSLIVTFMLISYLAFVIGTTSHTLGSHKHFIGGLLSTKLPEFTFVTEEESFNKVRDELMEIEEIDYLVYADLDTNYTTLDTEESEFTISRRAFYGDYPEDNLTLIDGRFPKGEDEIIITLTAKELSQKGIGDYIEIKHGEDVKEYLIVGLNGSVINSGVSFTTFTSKNIDQLDTDLGFYWVYTKEPITDYDAMNKKISERLNESVQIEEYDSNIGSVKESIAMFPVVMNMLLGIFMIVCAIVCINTSVIDISNSRRVYGIMKAGGFTTHSIKAVLLIKSSILTIVGVLLGYVAATLTKDLIMVLALSVTPFKHTVIAMISDPVMTGVIIIIFIAITIIGTLIPTRRVNRISPKQLISE